MARALPTRALQTRAFVIKSAFLTAILLSTMPPARPAARAVAVGSISGRVTSSTTSLGLQGTVVRFHDVNSDTTLSVTAVTDASGDYTANLPVGSFAVFTQDIHGYINEIYDNVPCSAVCDLNAVTPLVVTNNALTGIDFELDPGGRIAGTVTSTATGLPIANVRVNFTDSNAQLVFTSGVTDASGNYITDAGTATGSVYAFTENSQGFQNEVYDNVLCFSCDPQADGVAIPVTVGVTTGNVNFALDPGGRITGTVTNASATPLPGVLVVILDSTENEVGYTFTDGSGTYSTPGFPSGSYYAMTVNDAGLVDEVYNNVNCPAGWCDRTTATLIPVTVGATVSGIDFVLGEGGTISGTVTAAAGGAPIQDVEIGIFNPSGGFVTGTRSNADGGYTTGAMPAGTYYAMTTDAQGFAGQLYNGVPCANFCAVTNGTPITVVANQSSANINFSLSVAGSISGTVTDTSTGLPVNGRQVQVFSTTGLLAASTTTDAFGVYTASGLPPASYYVRTSGAGTLINELYNDVVCMNCNVVATSGSTPVVVTAGATTANIDFALSPGGMISGTVTNAANGIGIQSISVQVFTSGGVFLGNVATAPSGTYTTSGLPPGSYFVRTVNNLGFTDELYDDIPCVPCSVTTGTPIVVTAGVTQSGVNFALVAGGAIAGTVTDAGTAAGLPSIVVQIFTSGGSIAKSAPTNSSGAYVVSGLPAGTYYARTSVGGTQYYQDELYNELPCAPTCTVTTGTPIVVSVNSTQNGVNFTLSAGAGSISGTVTNAVTAAAAGSVQVQVFTAGGTFAKSASTNGAGVYSIGGLPAGTYYARTNTLQYVDELYNELVCFPTCTVTTGTPIVVVNGATQTGIDFALSANLIRNARFTIGTTNWLQFATPDMSYIVSQVTGGVFEYYRVPPPPGTSNSAVVFQETGTPLAAQVPLVARFSLGNSSTVRKRISVLVIDSNFSDISVCTFWLPPNMPLTPYRMKTHTTKTWANAALYFYAASAGSTGGFYRLDDVSLEQAPNEPVNRTECVDPIVPAPPGGAASADLLVNGNFDTGTVPPWGLFGQIVSQINAGVFEFYRPAGVPAGVVLQPTGQPMTANEIMTATFQLGNSSGVRKRVTVILHDNNFSDLSACTFWLAPGQPLSDYAMQTYATKAWSNATVSIYGATVGTQQWIRLDNATFKRTPSAAIHGTECLEPGASPLDVNDGVARAAPASVSSPARLMQIGKPEERQRATGRARRESAARFSAAR